MGCFLHWTAKGADPQWGLSVLQRVPQGALSHGARTVRARCAHGSMFLGWLPNLYPVEWPP